MSVTLDPHFSLQDTAEEAVPFCRSVPVSGDGGSGRDPALPAPHRTARRTDP